MPLDTAERFMRKIQALTGEQLREVARRYLVDDGIMLRENGQYWRIGGSVPD